jgi:hypothetical protein
MSDAIPDPQPVTAVPDEENLIAATNALPDSKALTVLADVTQALGLSLDASTARDTATHLRQALAGTLSETDAIAPDRGATPADLARTALAHLAHQPSHRALITRALTLPDRSQRLDPATLALAALVLYAFRADLDLTHDPDKGWSFHFRTKPLPDNTIGKILAQLLGTFTK